MMDGGECITRELIKIGPVVAGYNLPDGVYTASSVYSNQYEAYRAKLTDYLEGGVCGWVVHGTDTDPWLGVTLPDDNIIGGAIISIRCHSHIYMTMATYSTSYDDVTWQMVAEREDLSTRYNDEQDA